MSCEGDDRMAREEHDREDLLAEATALVERIELAVAELTEPVVIGFRRDGCGSIYFGADPAYHFNTQGELRRAYADGRLYKAERGRLASLTRRRTGAAVELLRHDLDETEAAEFLSELASRCERLRAALDADGFDVVGQVPEQGDVVGRVQRWLGSLSLPPRIAVSPRVK